MVARCAPISDSRKEGMGLFRITKIEKVDAQDF
jgi:hypothetical protein